MAAFFFVCRRIGVTRPGLARTASSLVASYDAKVAGGQLKSNPVQRGSVLRLEQLCDALKHYTPPPVRDGTSGSGLAGLWRKFSGGGASSSPASSLSSAPRGLYLFGDVGAGKTMLMDMFFASAPVARKRRVHFNAFMLDVHARIHAWKQSKTGTDRQYDPILPVASDISREVSLLCFDEFQVSDVVDAVILRRLFTTLFDNGVVMVATSNRRPEDLYKNGLQRNLFVPFIDLLKERCEVLDLSAGIDYRMTNTGASVLEQTFLVPDGHDTRRQLHEAFSRVAGVPFASAQPARLRVLGRNVHVPHAANGVAFFDFERLFHSDVGAVDYLALCEHFHTIFVQAIPVFSLAQKEAARRFIVFVDTLYDKQVRLVCTAKQDIGALMQADSQLGRHDGNRIMMDDLSHHSPDAAKASVFTGEDEVFAFRRTQSRLSEMRTQEYWAAAAAMAAQRAANPVATKSQLLPP